MATLNPPWADVGNDASIGVAERAGLTPVSSESGGNELVFPTQPSLPGDTQVWQRVFFDDFLGNAIDTSRWRVIDGVSGQNGVIALASNIVVADSIASFVLSDATHGAAIVGNYSNEGGGDNTVSVPQGAYVEARCLLPVNGAGVPYNWTGPWLSSSDFSTAGYPWSYQEIDMLETYNAATINYHTNTGQSGPVTLTPASEYVGAWHDYGVFLGPANHVTFYIDGVQVGQLATDGSQLTQWLRFTHGWQSPFPQGIGLAFAAQMDYFGVWVPASFNWGKQAASPLVRSSGVNGAGALIFPSSRFASTYDINPAQALTIETPGNFSGSSTPPEPGDEITFVFRMGATPYAITFAAGYKLITGASIPVTATTVSTITFQYDGAAWRQTAPVITTAA